MMKMTATLKLMDLLILMAITTVMLMLKVIRTGWMMTMVTLIMMD
jgi:hypothetical protein